MITRLCALVAVAMTLAGCGQAQRAGPDGAVLHAARASVDAAVEGNAPALCQSLTLATRASLVNGTRLHDGTCASVIAQRMRQGAFGADYKPLAAAIDRRSDAFVRVSATGESGLVTFAPPHARAFEVPLHRGAGGGWRSVGIIECGLKGCGQ